MKNLIAVTIISILAICCGSAALAWGPIGHKVVGGLGLDDLEPGAEQRLHELMGTSDLEQLTDWCNWPDEYRATDAGAWSSPLHYVNIPRDADSYEAARDCSAELCVTAAIPRYAAELADTSLDRDQRQRAFGFVCHLTGDLAQTLHAGFGHDRGGNLFMILYQGQELNLHEFWDHTLIEENTDHWNPLYQSLRNTDVVPDQRRWISSLAIQWTNESHHLAVAEAYPATQDISPEFAGRSWQMIRQQLKVGGRNLALVLNSALGNSCSHDKKHTHHAQTTNRGQP